MRLFVLALVLTFSVVDSNRLFNSIQQNVEDNQSDQTNAKANQSDIINQYDALQSNTVETQDTSDKKILPKTIKNDLINDNTVSSLFGGQFAYSSSVSKELENGFLKYSPTNALTRGSNYWKSEDNLSSTDKIEFVVIFKLPKMVGGVDVEWVKSPVIYNIDYSITNNDGTDKWEPISSSISGDFSYTKFQNFFLCKKIKLTMVPDGYVAIRSVRFVGQSDVLFRIQSGITSVQDMCLQVDKTGDVVLASCLIPIAMNSGLDIFKFNSDRQLYLPALDKCIVIITDESTITNNGFSERVGVGDCKEYLDKGGSIWHLTSQNQLMVDKSGDFCLSQKGSKAGFIDVAMSKLISSSDDSSDFPPYNAVDGNPTTKWQSRPFKPAKPRVVSLTLDLMESYKVESVEILWDSIPLTYEIHTALIDDKGEFNFKRAVEVKSNILDHTHNELSGIICQFVKITMRNGLAEPLTDSDVATYGIRSISILTNRLTTVIEECSIAKKSFDTRDKYFFESVYNFEINKLDKVRENLDSLIYKVEDLSSTLERLPVDSCRRDALQKSEKLEFLEKEFEAIAHDLSKFNYTQLAKSKILGISSKNPGRDCMEIKNHNPKNPSGFYYIQPECTSESIRVYCDMKMGFTYLIHDLDVGSVSISDAIDTCKAMGLDMIRIYDPAQIPAIQHMLKMIDSDPEFLYPVAFISENEFKSLDMEIDSTEQLINLVKPNASDNTIAVSRNGLVSMDSTSKEMAGVLCGFYGKPMTHIDCITTMQKFKHTLGSEYLFSCPSDCLEKSLASGMKLIGGFEPLQSNTSVGEDNAEHYVSGTSGGSAKAYMYTVDSSLCLAAINSGHRLIHVRVVQGPERYEGLAANGVVAESAEGMGAQLAVQILEPCRKLPITNRSAGTSAPSKPVNTNGTGDPSKPVNTNSTGDPSKPVNTNGTGDPSKPVNTNGTGDPSKPVNTNGTGDPSKPVNTNDTGDATTNTNRSPADKNTSSKNNMHDQVLDSTQEINITTQHQIGLLVRLLEKSMQETSDSFITLLSTHVNHILHKFRGIITPTLFSHIKNNKNMSKLEKNFTGIQFKLDSVSTRLVTKVKESYDIYKSTKLKLEKHRALLPWSINDIKNFNLEFGYLGTGVWEINDQTIVYTNQMHEHDNSPSVCVKRDKNLFDFIYVATIMFTGNGYSGLVFRFQNPTNYYLVQLLWNDKDSGDKFNRLVRVQDGVAHELARVTNINGEATDGPFAESVTIRIEARRERLGISFLKTTNDVYTTPPFDINVIDDGLLSGTFGFIASGLPRVTFNNVNIETISCVNDIYTPPIPKTCTRYKVEGIISDDWISIPPGKIEVSNLNSTESFAPANDDNQFTSVKTRKSLVMRDLGDHRYYLLGNRKSCLFGTFRFTLFLQCTDGFAGGVVRFSNANNYIAYLTSTTGSKLIQVTDGVPLELANSSTAVKVGRWYKVNISMTGEDDNLFISVFMNEELGNASTPASTRILSKSTKNTSRNKRQLFAVGLTNRGCKAVAFANISLESGGYAPPVIDDTKKIIELKLSAEGSSLLSLCRTHSQSVCGGDVECCKACCVTARDYSVKAGRECEHSCVSQIGGNRVSSNNNTSRLYNNSEL